MKKYFKIGLFVFLVWCTQLALAQDTIPLNTVHSFEATNSPGYSYSWWYVDDADNKTYFTSTTNKTEDYFWDTQGDYQLFVQAKDSNNCLSEIISKGFEVVSEPDIPGNIAGSDSTIGVCEPYVLGGVIQDEENYTFLWEPAGNLDDPTSARPVFTPGSSTVFTLFATNINNGNTILDSVEITVTDIVAEAGEDLFMYQGETTILDGSASLGEGLQYSWTSSAGIIDSGENTAYPIVSGFGTYYLEVTDTFTCVASDSVSVQRLTDIVANDDYDTTSYRSEVKIPVLDNDTDSENSIDPSTLTITLPPYNGSAYVDYDDFTIHYRPNEGFSGNDNFEYRICNTFNNCDLANVYVWVTEYKFLIPEAFSPNADNINDYFEILGIEAYDGNSIVIFNRWGNKVYEAVNYGINTTPKFWDGKSNTGVAAGDDELPTGTYFYILKFGDREKPIAGSVYLDR